MEITNPRFLGNDNYGKPKLLYLEKLRNMDDEKLFEEAEQTIWLSAYASNNPRSDYHWQVSAIYNECDTRKKPEIYRAAFEKAKSSAS